jgi:adenine-specific DNA-methyltransferase
MDFRHPYLTDQLIAYIGNKRALLPFLHGVFSRLVMDPARALFLDPFAGSGSVSRLARMMGFTVAANDWEPYSEVINRCHLGETPRSLDSLFRSRGGLVQVLERLNSLPAPPVEEQYISRHYAPRDTGSADWRTERLFYTRENALALDAMRQGIEEMYPGVPSEPTALREKMVLLAPLLYEAATHTNTSGVFKACHRGFGGHGRDALKRIMGSIRLSAPVLVESAAPATVTALDASAFLRGRGADICYLDPPYSGHQYGSNYFMLNSIARWDRPPVSDEHGADGRLLKKAGIRADWVSTRSDFCYRSTAREAMSRVVDAADCRWLVVSYSNEGLIGLEELCDLLSATGCLSMHSTGYVKYPGGRQSLDRTNRNVEMALVVDRRARSTDGTAVRRMVRQVEMARLMGRAFDPLRIRASFPVEGEGIRAGPGAAVIPMRHHWRFASDTRPPLFPSETAAARFIETLSACALSDARQEIDVLLGVVGETVDPMEKEKLLKEILRLANKLAHRKYREIFSRTLEVLRAYGGTDPLHRGFRQGLDAIAERAQRRMRARSAG